MTTKYTEMQQIDRLFDRMDSWRHLPSYQLERRADLLFSLYLAEALEDKLGFAIHRHIIPEFPIRNRSIGEPVEGNRSFKVDYLAISEDANTAILVELKTDPRSYDDDQCRRLKIACLEDFNVLLKGVRKLFRATTANRKYFCLFEELEAMGLARIPSHVREIMQRENIQGITHAAREIEITSETDRTILVYIVPDESNLPDECYDLFAEDELHVISFEEFREKTVQRHSDMLSNRFAQSLQEWADMQAGCRSNQLKE